MKWLSMGIFLFIIQSSLFAQHCGFDEINKEQSSTHLLQLEENIQNWISNHGSNYLRSTMVIPIVIHVIYRTSSQNISEEQILSQLEVLNEDFRMMNENAGETPMAFEDLSADLEIEFCLVKRDPDGNSTTGILRSETMIQDIGLTQRFYKSDMGGQDLWDTDRYVNIYICELGNDILGFSSFPHTQDEFDGIVVQPQFFGTEGSALLSSPHHMGRTLTHELGHYFGLVHLWGKEGSICDEGDFVDDTPRQETSSDGCPTFPLRDICSPSNKGVLFCNFMDYTNDSCLTMFTHGQKLRVQAQIDMYRSGLISHPVCTPVGNKNHLTQSITASWNMWTNQICFENLDINQSSLHVNIYNMNGKRVMSKSDFIYNNCLTFQPTSAGCYSLLVVNHEILTYSTIFVVAMLP